MQVHDSRQMMNSSEALNRSGLREVGRFPGVSSHDPNTPAYKKTVVHMRVLAVKGESPLPRTNFRCVIPLHSKGWRGRESGASRVIDSREMR
jgi:hypothetical protein